MSPTPANYPHSAERYAADVARSDEYIGRNPLPFVRCPNCGSAWAGDTTESAANLAAHLPVCPARRGSVDAGRSFMFGRGVSR